MASRCRKIPDCLRISFNNNNSNNNLEAVVNHLAIMVFDHMQDNNIQEAYSKIFKIWRKELEELELAPEEFQD
tara:strand:- start:82 stop:300 length:219 start_codon:yes stop_codon:yes gene_type:complete